jgi:hypothetical protein
MFIKSSFLRVLSVSAVQSPICFKRFHVCHDQPAAHMHGRAVVDSRNELERSLLDLGPMGAVLPSWRASKRARATATPVWTADHECVYTTITCRNSL